MAEDDAFFAGVDFSVGAAHGSSSTTDGGASFAGGGVVTDVDFGGSTMIGGHVGYRIDSALSGFISYQHHSGDIRWSVDFPMFAVSSGFGGTAISDAVTGNLAYEIPVSEAAAVRIAAGAGLAFNRLSGIVETDSGTGIFLADVESHTRLSAVARVEAGLRYRIAPRVALGLKGSFSYAGGFGTGDTRSGNLGVTEINPYRIGDVWRKDLGVSLTLDL
jgi:hypothetical protein